MTLLPLYGFLAGDTLGLVILVRSDAKVAAIADSLVQAAAPRVAPPAHPTVYWKGRALDPAQPIRETGIAALDRVDVR